MRATHRGGKSTSVDYGERRIGEGALSGLTAAAYHDGEQEERVTWREGLKMLRRRIERCCVKGVSQCPGHTGEAM